MLVFTSLLNVAFTNLRISSESSPAEAAQVDSGYFTNTLIAWLNAPEPLRLLPSFMPKSRSAIFPLSGFFS